jgi:hypothetical protein
VDDLSHVIVTRLNIGRGRDVAWTRKRIELMIKYCVPGVAAQTHDEFRWVILVGADMRDPMVKSLLTTVSDMLPYNVSVLKVPNTDWPPVFAEWCRSVILTEWLATTRLDSDDALHPDYIAGIDSAARPETEILAYEGGYVLQLPERSVHHFKTSDTNFQTLVEPAATAQGAYCAQHGHLRKKFKVRVLSMYPRWLVLRHDTNWHYSRKRKGACPLPAVPAAEATKHFGFLGI